MLPPLRRPPPSMLRRAVGALSAARTPTVAAAFEAGVFHLPPSRGAIEDKGKIPDANGKFSSGPGDSAVLRCYMNQSYLLDATHEPCYSFSSGTALSPSRSLPSRRHLSSQAGMETSDGESSVDDGLSKSRMPSDADKMKETDTEGDTSESESESDEEELNFPESEVDDDRTLEGTIPALLKSIMNPQSGSIGSILDKFVEDGHRLGRSEVSVVFLTLRRQRQFTKALKLFEWLETHKPFEFVKRDYACHVDLIAKVHGPNRAEKYIEKIPEAFRDEVVYRTLLANCVYGGNLKKSEEVFNKMRDLGFPLTVFACNQLLLLYKRIDRKKIADVLLMMENENINPDLMTYKLLIDVKGRSNDIDGMEQVVESMKAEGLEQDMNIRSRIAWYYIEGGCNEKAEALLKEIEGTNIMENRIACKVLLPLYASLGKVDDVERIWGICKQKPRVDECLAAIQAWDKLGNVENAEAVFEQMKRNYKSLSSKYYNALLTVYANHELIAKGNELVKQMQAGGLRIGPTTWNAVLNLYLRAGELEKADSFLEKVASESKRRPMYYSYLSLLEKYARRGDVHNAEKIFEKMRSCGYSGRMRSYHLLLEAYVMAKAPAYGFRERMKADQMFPNISILKLLRTAEAFKNTVVANRPTN